MAGTRFEALARDALRNESKRQGRVTRRAAPHPARGGPAPMRGAAFGPAYHDPSLWQVEDPARYLMAPDPRFQSRVGRAARAAAVICAMCLMTPVLPAIMSIA